MSWVRRVFVEPKSVYSWALTTRWWTVYSLKAATHKGTRIKMRGERENAKCRKKTTRLKTLKIFFISQIGQKERLSDWKRERSGLRARAKGWEREWGSEVQRFGEEKESVWKAMFYSLKYHFLGIALALIQLTFHTDKKPWPTVSVGGCSVGGYILRCCSSVRDCAMVALSGF